VRSQRRSANARRTTTLTFWLSRRARVTFLVRRVAPDCRVVGKFSVRGRKGTNRIRFAGRVGRKHLSSGRYTITPLVRSSRRVLAAVSVTVGRRGQLLSARTMRGPSACTAAGAAAAGSSERAGQGSGTAGGQGASGGVAGVDSQAIQGSPTASESRERVLTPAWVPYIPEASPWLQVFFLAALGLAALLLLLAALPAAVFGRGPARDRAETWRLHVGAAGVSTLVAAAVIFLIAGTS